MAEIINLRRARKAKVKIEGDKQAAENRIRFGRSKAERERGAAEDAIAVRRIEGHRRDPVSSRDDDPSGEPR